LNVFPILVPPLRERTEDIPLLVRYFAQKLSRRMKKRIESIPNEAMDAMMRYRWPGNIRELENFIERAVILSKGTTLQAPISELRQDSPIESSFSTDPDGPGTTLEAAEREHILKALRDTNWMIGGPAGAAARLGMKRTTLQSKMKKLGIARPPA
jgi:formate hydrogenlyase transcriptional activator